MEDFSMNSTSLNESYNSSNITTEHYDSNNAVSIADVVTCIIIGIGLPLTLVAIYAIYSLIRKDHVAPIYVINLLISDLIQFCCMIILVARRKDRKIYVIVSRIYALGVMASVGFMVCVALERYLVIAWPLWYRFRRTIKTSVMVCVLVWALPLVFFLTSFFWSDFEVRKIIYAVFLLLPCPLLLFFLVGTLKALSASISVPSDEKRRIVGILVIVLLIYTLLFLPSIISHLAKGAKYNNTFSKVSSVFLQLSPLADLTLYVFIRKGMIDKLLASLCCCTMENNGTSTSTV